MPLRGEVSIQCWILVTLYVCLLPSVSGRALLALLLIPVGRTKSPNWLAFIWFRRPNPSGLRLDQWIKPDSLWNVLRPGLVVLKGREISRLIRNRVRISLRKLEVEPHRKRFSGLGCICRFEKMLFRAYTSHTLSSTTFQWSIRVQLCILYE